jgi:hypothetical protein
MGDKRFESDVQFPEWLRCCFKFYRFSEEFLSYALQHLFTFILKQEKMKANYNQTTG